MKLRQTLDFAMKEIQMFEGSNSAGEVRSYLACPVCRYLTGPSIMRT
ncbi:hypothetical protein FRUB_07616 [Fimbriiglobus ruber]|uniref:Uncharacterized protein n=1 Tax=Fimbriiglobus ruber TaxID=1908690 RepID=A0A225DLZ2_9BACT|nr:hypothetical protein FRUB_07616 [Fimbriiglobus ruber]